MTKGKTMTQLSSRIAALESLLSYMIPCIQGKLAITQLISDFQNDFQSSPAFANLNQSEKQAVEEIVERILRPAMKKLSTVRR